MLVPSRWVVVAAASAAVLGSFTAARDQRIVVRTSAELSAALRGAGPGTTIALASGSYDGNIYAASVAGSAAAPIIIEAADADDRPVIRGGDTGIQLSDVEHVTLRRLVFEQQRQNGVNIDDAETVDTPSRHVTMSELAIRDIRTDGIAAGVKLSGVQDFVIEDSVIERWGGGSAITAIGAHRGVVRGNTFRHRDDAGATGLQIKGGSTRILVRENRFEHAGIRAVQLGGSTGPQFFRPQPPARYEAADCRIEHNVFIGSEAVVTYATADGSLFTHNTVYRPARWLLRILQETTSPAFVPSRRGELRRNVIYFHGDDFPIGVVNIGTGTDAASFRFAENWWYRADRPGDSRPNLPSAEIDGVYGRDPGFVDAAAGDLRLAVAGPAFGYGAQSGLRALLPRPK
jgi:hypothetical protein